MLKGPQDRFHRHVNGTNVPELTLQLSEGHVGLLPDAVTKKLKKKKKRCGRKWEM